MKNKELIKLLKKYDGDVEIKLWWIMQDYDWLYGYFEEKMRLQDVIESNYNWKTTLIFTIPSLEDED